MNRLKRKLKVLLKGLDGFILGNTVLAKGMVIAPVVVAATDVKCAFVISLAFAILSLLSIFISALIPRRLGYAARVMLDVFIASVVYIPIYFVLSRLFAQLVLKIGIFLPLLVANSLLIERGEAQYHHLPDKQQRLYVLHHILGFVLAAMLIGCVRELFGAGTILGHSIGWIVPINGLLYPFGGFILLGFLGAGLARFETDLSTRKKKRQKRGMEVLKDEPVD